MRRSIKTLFIGFLMMGILAKTASAQLVSPGEKANEETPKVIAVVLDDSTSMVRDDSGSVQKNYTTRWAEADYAVRALAAMMASGDILRIYPLNGKELVSVTIGEDDLRSGLFQRLDKMGYYGATMFDRVREAVADLKRVRQKDLYLVVITDGNFQWKTDSGKTEYMTKADLDNEFEKILRASNIGAHYIQIGTNEKNITPSNSQLIIHSDISEGITKQITDVINEIYHRVAMDGTDRASLVSNSSGDNLAISFNVPVQNVTVFLQGNADWKDIQVSAEPYSVTKMEIHPKAPDFPALWKSTKEICNPSYIKSLQLTGVVINCDARDGGSTESISISGVPSANRGNIQVYYEPAVQQRVSVSQKDGISFVYGESTPLFVEGPVEFTIDYLKRDGLPVDDLSASMLKAGSTAITLEDRMFSRMPQKDGSYVFSGALTPTDSNKELVISNAIGLNGGSWIIPLGKIYEANLNLSAELFQEEDGLILDEEGKGILSILLSNQTAGTALTQEEWISGIKVGCDSEIFNVDVESIDFKDGIIRLPVSLKNTEDHQLDETETFSITTVKTYSDGVRPPTAVNTPLPAVKVGSVPHTLSMSWESGPVKLIWAAIFGRTIPVSYFCDGEPLTEQQRQNAELTLNTADSAFEGMIALENGSIHLEPGLFRWLNMQDTRGYVSELVFSYTKWNHPEQISEQVELELIPISGLQLAGAIVLLLFMIILAILLSLFGWWFFIGTKKRSDYIGKNTSFGLQSHADPTERGFTRLGWSRGSQLLFRADFRKNRYAHLRRHLSSKKDDGSLHTTIDLYVRREGDGWRLEKLGKTKPASGEGCLRIGDAAVSSDRCCFLTDGSGQERLELKRPEYDHVWWLKIEEEDSKR